MRHALASRPLTGSEEGGASQLIAVSHLSPVLSLAPVNALFCGPSKRPTCLKKDSGPEPPNALGRS